MKLRNLNREYLLRKINEMEELSKDIEELQNLYSDEQLIKKVICKELKEVEKKYGKDRKTDIVYYETIENVSQEDIIDDYNVKIFITKHNYFKKITLASLRSSSEQKLKENDLIIQEIETNNKSEILLFSNKYNLYKVKLYEVSECKASSLGEYLNNILILEDDENIIYMTPSNEYKGYMLFIFENGKIAKIEMSSYYTKMNRKKLINAYSNKFNLIKMIYIESDCDIVIFRDEDKAMLINTSIIPAKNTKNSVGVNVYSLKKRSFIRNAIIAKKFNSENIEYYRSIEIPSSGHFIMLEDKIKNVNIFNI